jgi:hypothetical protein
MKSSNIAHISAVVDLGRHSGWDKILDFLLIIHPEDKIKINSY